MAAHKCLTSLQWNLIEHGGVSIICSSVCSGAAQRKHQSSSSLAFVGGYPPVTGGFPSQRASNVEMFPFDDVIILYLTTWQLCLPNWIRPLVTVTPWHPPIYWNSEIRPLSVHPCINCLFTVELSGKRHFGCIYTLVISCTQVHVIILNFNVTSSFSKAF